MAEMEEAMEAMRDEIAELRAEQRALGITQQRMADTVSAHEVVLSEGFRAQLFQTAEIVESVQIKLRVQEDLHAQAITRMEQLEEWYQGYQRAQERIETTLMEHEDRFGNVVLEKLEDMRVQLFDYRGMLAIVDAKHLEIEYKVSGVDETVQEIARRYAIATTAAQTAKAEAEASIKTSID